ncbi:sigma 54-interacting transcriptional regulator [Rhodocytophaga aerolata]|uniref:Sigma 54-interacting transcriptional regulator n=1 Tax=Rhodocytophaga aerolata TaxID=455078 RepID=A0ABT8RC60_9BACT|nr:sigma 54-interacting transcriptional regulator [Rhodocytophaga aerolata]MDO1449692.1 sigma 54-interacting transcriptional regulator [Rhodocytophaga aerolata]
MATKSQPKSKNAFEKKEKEQDTLLLLSAEIAQVRHKNDLLGIVQNKLKEFFTFDDIVIVLFHETKMTFTILLSVVGEGRGKHKLFDEILTIEYPVEDGIHDAALKSEHAVVLHIDELMKNPDKHLGIQFIYDTGIKEIAAIKLRYKNNVIGFLTLLSEQMKAFEKANLNFLQPVSNLLSIAVANILANEAIEQREKEKEILFSMGQALANVRGREDLLETINTKFRELFYFSHAGAGLINEDKQTYSAFLSDPASIIITHDEYDNLVTDRHLIADGIFDVVLLREQPLVVNIDQVVASGNAPLYIKITHTAGFKEAAFIRLRHREENMGMMVFYADKTHCFSPYTLRIIQSLSNQVSTAIANILANEAIQKRELEREILLELSDQMVSVRDKKDLLVGVISSKLKKLLYFTHCAICVINKNSNTFDVFLLDTGSASKNHPKYQDLVAKPQPVQDGVFNIILQSKYPLVYDLDTLIEGKNAPFYVQINHESGIREMATVPLYEKQIAIGILFVFSNRKKSFTPKALDLIQGISLQLSTAVANIIANEEIKRREEEKSILLSLSNDMSLVRNKEDLARIINQKLKKLFFIKDFTIVAIHGHEMTYGPYLFDQEDTPYKKKYDYLHTLYTNFEFEKGLYDVVLKSDRPVVFDIEEMVSRKDVPGHAIFFHSIGIDFIIGAALRIGNENFGVLWIQPETVSSFNTVNTTVFTGVCSQISIALANIIANEALEKRDREKATLLSLSNALASIRGREDLLNVIKYELKKLFNYNDASIIILDESKTTYRAFVLDMEERRTSHVDCAPNAEGVYPVADGVMDAILKAEIPIVLDYETVITHPAAPSWAVFLYQTGIREMVSVVLRDSNEVLGAFFLHSESKQYFQPYQLSLIQGISYQLSTALANVLANEKIANQLQQINHYKSQLEEENLYLQAEIGTAYNYGEIIGTSDAMQKVFHLLSQVAFTNSTVLILGETGTGKELIARAIHNTSPRKDKLMVKVNCAALPANLIESELFGHERGSFTGATERRIGKFELANHGTLFLDEIGEMPLDLQVKLLRALQEKEIERIGGKSTIKVNVRIIAATNRNLQKEVQEGRFRSDLFYRLNVFPITMPPLRDHKEDIPLLASYFIDRFARNAGRKITNISHMVLQQLTTYEWPGNVRELEHLIERSILLAKGSTIKEIHLPFKENKVHMLPSEDVYLKTLEENERDHILAVLRNCHGKVFGPGGAAEILNIHVSTLNSRIKKLGIKKEHIFMQKK